MLVQLTAAAGEFKVEDTRRELRCLKSQMNGFHFSRLRLIYNGLELRGFEAEAVGSESARTAGQAGLFLGLSHSLNC
jgi:hypothetical protein